MIRLIRCCCLMSVALMAGQASAQSINLAQALTDAARTGVTFIRDPQTYGTQFEVAHVMPATAFTTLVSTMTYSLSNGKRWVTNNGGCCLDGPVSLPAGASMTAIEVEGCDNSATGEIFALFVACPSPAVNCSVPNVIHSGTAATPGCAFFRSNFSSPMTVDNVANSYYFEFYQGGDATGLVTLRAVRIYYKLQISPDPATATFTDVPLGHPLHRFVEALVAAGITGGCGGGNYCPDAPITRGQMAVFLSAALGLHWAP